jgi:N6-L-threonylcarbamoyladenine synthase
VIHPTTILGIETSCDETAAALWQEGSGVVSSVLHSQISTHAQFGGVVPELASRSHLEKIGPIVQGALDQADCTLDDITHIAVTTTPGLPGSLLVGLCFAKGIAYARNIPIIGVNHLQGHVYSGHLEHDIPFPYLCLTVSGGHTALYIVHDYVRYELIGHTMDDAAGEAFDKIAKLMHLPYPGGPVLERLAREVDFTDAFKYPRLKDVTTLDMSFSGLKTAVLYHMIEQGWYDRATKMATQRLTHADRCLIASSLHVCIKDIFIQRLTVAYQRYPQVRALSFVGGVACNQYLKQTLAQWAAKYNLAYATPSRSYCTDNAAMIAFVGYQAVVRNAIDDLTIDIW